MSVIVYGRPGASLEADGTVRYGRDYARRGAFFEKLTGGALEGWLADAPGEYHLLHDLTRFGTVAARPGLGLGPMDVGSANIDHVVLTGAGWLMVNAKGTGKGTLRLDDRGCGVLVREDGGVRRQPWLDKATGNAHAGILVRLLGSYGCSAWVVPDWTVVDQDSLTGARCLRPGADVSMIVTAAQARSGELDRLPVMTEASHAPPVSPEAVRMLSAYVWDKSAPPRAGVALPPRQGSKDAVRGGRHPRAKLSAAILAECRTLKAAGETERAIAKRFGVSQSTLHRALSGQTWRETKGREEPPAKPAEVAAPEPPRYPWSR